MILNRENCIKFAQKLGQKTNKTKKTKKNTAGRAGLGPARQCGCGPIRIFLSAQKACGGARFPFSAVRLDRTMQRAFRSNKNGSAPGPNPSTPIPLASRRSLSPSDQERRRREKTAPRPPSPAAGDGAKAVALRLAVHSLPLSLFSLQKTAEAGDAPRPPGTAAGDGGGSTAPRQRLLSLPLLFPPTTTAQPLHRERDAACAPPSPCSPAPDGRRSNCGGGAPAGPLAGVRELPKESAPPPSGLVAVLFAPCWGSFFFLLLSFSFLFRRAVVKLRWFFFQTPRLADARPNREERRGLTAAQLFRRGVLFPLSLLGLGFFGGGGSFLSLISFLPKILA